MSKREIHVKENEQKAKNKKLVMAAYECNLKEVTETIAEGADINAFEEILVNKGSLKKCNALNAIIADYKPFDQMRFKVASYIISHEKFSADSNSVGMKSILYLWSVRFKNIAYFGNDSEKNQHFNFLVRFLKSQCRCK